jgi:Ca2+-binding RTX toxin-like protein
MMSEWRGRTGGQAVLVVAVIAAALLLSSGVALAATITCQAGVQCFGTKKADTLVGTGGPDRMFGRGGADTLKGFGSGDILNGQRGRDTLSGGSETDYLIGGVGNDALKGGAGAELYFFGPGWGKDSVIDTTASGTEIRFFSDESHGTPVTADVIVDLRSGAGPEAEDKSGTNTINWDGNVVDTVIGGTGDDHIMGNASANLITGSRGDDTIFGGRGNDEIRVLDDSSGDTVHCGAGEDTVLYDITDLVGVLRDSVDLGDCEHRIANP